MGQIKENQNNNLINKPPVVVVMGHVDHGKTTLIDWIRKTKVAEKESGGITQAIGAYQINHNGKLITFIDTPGHEAFSKIRSRGAKAADIAILVVAADDGVMPQTKEALDHIKFSQLAFIVAINKIDKPNAQIDRVKKQLSELGILLEGWGGDVSNVNISAKTGVGINELLDLIILFSEVNEFKADVSKNASGVILESKHDSRKGLVITALVNEGILNVGDYFFTAGNFGKIKFLADFLDRSINTASPSTPVLISSPGIDVGVGDIWIAFKTREEAEKAVLSYNLSKPVVKEIKQYDNKKVLDIVLKADVFGSLEAIESIIRDFNFKEVAVRIIKSGLGDVSEEDLKVAKISKAKVLGFKVKFLPQAESIAKIINVESIFFDVIYELIDRLKQEMAKLLPPEVIRIDLGELKVLASFGKSKEGLIIGGRVTKGIAKKSAKVEIIRNEKIIGSGLIISLQQNKDQREEVKEGQECGINLSSDTKTEVNDTLRFYIEETRIKQLE